MVTWGKLKLCYQGRAMRQMPRAQKRPCGHALAQRGGIPSPDGGRLAAVRTPAQFARQLQPRLGRPRPVPPEDGGGTVKLNLNVRAEMEGEPDVMPAPGDHIGDLDCAGGGVKPDRPAVPDRRIERLIAV